MKKIVGILFGFLVILGVGYFFVPQKETPRLTETEKTPLSTTSEQSQDVPTIPANWKTYRSEEYGFEFRYPSDGQTEDTKVLKGLGMELYLNIYYGKSKIYYGESRKSKSYLFLRKNDKHVELKDFILEPYRNCVPGPDSGPCLSMTEIDNLKFESFKLGNINGLKDHFTYFFVAPDKNDIVYISNPTQVNPGDEGTLEKILSTLIFR